MNLSDDVIITDLDGAEDILKYDKTIENIVSIGSPSSKLYKDIKPVGLDSYPASKLRLLFHDVEIPSVSLKSPTKRDIETLIKFLSRINGRTLFHCEYGESRSPAAALIYLYLKTKSEAEAVHLMYQIKSDVKPNMLILQYADEILGSKLSTYILV